MAMGLWLARVAGEAARWRIESAGTWALDGRPAAEYTQEVLLRRGIDLSEHQARTVDRAMLERFNLILTMQRGHKEALQIEFPDLAGRVFLLSEMVGKNFEIQDPIGGPLEDFEDTAREIDILLEQGEERIRRLAQGPDREDEPR